ncbi:MAG: DNA cytosine methyltransferase [bacterium]|nr:DNA cytosine methyltransferase [bacterium]
MKKNNKNKLHAIDFFCGAGGMTYGLSKAGIDVIAGIDIDSECRKTYEVNNPGSEFINSNIKALKCEDLEESLGIKKNDDSMIFVGCSPCQYWTKMNTIKGKSEASKNLLIDFKRFVEYFNPGHIVIENVPGIFRNQEESGLKDFLLFLEENNFYSDYDTIFACHHGVPQSRKRFLLVASRIIEGIKLPEKRKGNPPTVQQYIGEQNGFRKIEAGDTDDSLFIHSAASLTENNLKRIKKTKHDGGNRFAWKDDDELQIPAYKDKDHLFIDVYGRMYWNKPAPTITTRFNSLSNGRFGHPVEDRAISLREGATLQTFPKKYKFFGPNQSSITRQIGNAVPPELSKRIGKVFTKSFK